MKNRNLCLSMLFPFVLFLGCAKPKPEILQTDGNTASKVKCLYDLSMDRKAAKINLPLIIHATSDSNATVRKQAAVVIGKMKTDAITAIPALTSLLSDKDNNVRLTAIFVLNEMGVNARSSVPTLLKLFEQKDAQVDLLTIRTLGGIGISAEEAVPYLEKRLAENKDGIDIQAYITAALFSITGNSYMIQDGGKTITVVNSDGDTIKKFKSGIEINVPTKEEEKAADSLRLQKMAEEIHPHKKQNPEGVQPLQPPLPFENAH